VHPQLARPPPLVIEVPRILVFVDRAVEQVEIAVLGAGIGFGQAHLAAAHGFHLRPDQRDAGFERLFDDVIAARPPVLRHRRAAILVVGHGSRYMGVS
jgi:hypothetical protein